MIAGRVVLTKMDALFRLGRHREALAQITEPINWLETIGDRDNLDSVRLKLINALLNLKEYDAAESALDAIDEASLPALVGISYRSLRHMVEQHKPA